VDQVTVTVSASDLSCSVSAHSVLPWGWRYAVVRPDHFRVDYVINPYMDPRTQPDGRIARCQWDQLVGTLRRLGARVDVIGQRADAPDMVYAMNLGLAMSDDSGRRVLLSHMRHPQRRCETETAEAWFADAGFTPTYVGRAGVGAHLEAGDAFPFAGELVVGYGPRTERAALEQLAVEFDIPVRGLRITHPGMYHLDLAFCPLDSATALVCPAAFDEASARGLLAAVPDPIVLSEQESLTFCANSIVVSRTVVMPACPGRVRRELELRGFAVQIVDVGEFHKGGGSVRCLTNPLDIVIGRDLRRVPGGDVLLPSSSA
jgi:N-dimethylarginine dimethylaminohydrolase